MPDAGTQIRLRENNQFCYNFNKASLWQQLRFISGIIGSIVFVILLVGSNNDAEKEYPINLIYNILLVFSSILMLVGGLGFAEIYFCIDIHTRRGNENRLLVKSFPKTSKFLSNDLCQPFHALVGCFGTRRKESAPSPDDLEMVGPGMTASDS